MKVPMPDGSPEIPNPKLQIPSQEQTAKSKKHTGGMEPGTGTDIAVCSLGFAVQLGICDLGFGAWDRDFGKE